MRLSELSFRLSPLKEIYHDQEEHQPREHGAIKDPEEWTTGDEPMTGAQESYLHTLAREAGEPVAEDLTKSEASETIDELQQKTGRGIARPRRKTTARKKG